ncbi:MAG: DinB family protein [Planctomycetota bacterium]|jgi:uncharacterized damage-inducible protein DinB
MDIKEFLKHEAEDAYQATEKLFRCVDASSLDWKPETGTNWMTIGQCILHCTNSCGAMAKGFVTGDWGMPEDMDENDMLPGGEDMPTAESIDDVLEKLKSDQKAFNDSVDAATAEDLMNKMSVATWGGPERSLAGHINTCILHLISHKSQLFYYLKLKGQDMNTKTLWGV